jgi:hypothetical protein
MLGQIYAALIVYLLLCYTKFLCNLSVTLQNFMRILQLNLFRTCSLQELFEPPSPVPDNLNVNNQLCLALAQPDRNEELPEYFVNLAKGKFGFFLGVNCPFTENLFAFPHIFRQYKHLGNFWEGEPNGRSGSCGWDPEG